MTKTSVDATLQMTIVKACKEDMLMMRNMTVSTLSEHTSSQLETFDPSQKVVELALPSRHNYLTVEVVLYLAAGDRLFRRFHANH